MVIADKNTGFANFRLNNITHLNDLKWTKPGHLTFKIFPQNLNDFYESSGLTVSNKITKKKKKYCSRLTESSTSDDIQQLVAGLCKADLEYSTRIGNSFGSYSELLSNFAHGQTKEEYIFAAIRFNSEFECSKFFDFYRNLFVDSQNDDLFNPHFHKGTSKISMMRVFLKKITKNSISSPVAFHHINSLSMKNSNMNQLQLLTNISS